VTLLALIGISVLGSQQSISYLHLLVLILFGILFGVLIFLFDTLYEIFRRIFHLKPWAGIGTKIDEFRTDVIVTLHYSTFLGALCLGIIGWAYDGLGFFLMKKEFIEEDIS